MNRTEEVAAKLYEALSECQGSEGVIIAMAMREDDVVRMYRCGNVGTRVGLAELLYEDTMRDAEPVGPSPATPDEEEEGMNA